MFKLYDLFMLFAALLLMHFKVFVSQVRVELGPGCRYLALLLFYSARTYSDF